MVCLLSIALPDVPQVYLSSTFIESLEEWVKEQISEEYADFVDVFSKAKASGLPLHHSFDCTIDLLLGTPSCSKVYPLSITEQKAMEEYSRRHYGRDT